MKFFLFILISTQLFSLNIVLNSTKESGESYSILHVEDTNAIDCRIIPQKLDKEIYLCKFDKITASQIQSKKMPLVDIEFIQKEKEFFIKIMPKVHSRLIPIEESLYNLDEITPSNSDRLSKHWMVLLYKKDIFTKITNKDSINFPILYPKKQKPFIGALDVNGAPISYVQSRDIELYLALKKSFENGRYENVVEDSLDIVAKYPQSIFKSELLLYRLRAIDIGLGDQESPLSKDFEASDIVTEAKRWIKTFPSDEAIPEVLQLIVKGYLQMGSKADTNYFLDILISEHPESPFTKQAILLFADSIYNTKDQAKALKLYQDVLYSAKDLDIASQAAIRLADREISRGQTQKAKEYLMKVVSANSAYLLKDPEASYALATKLSQNKLYDIAALIADLLLEEMKKTNDLREEVLRDSGLWHAKANDVKKAYESLTRYTSEYKDGSFSDQVQESLDALFFELNETNETKLSAYYDTLIEQYQNKIGDRATIEKAKLLLSQERYRDVLKMQDSLRYVSENNTTEATDLIQNAANALAILALKDDTCSEAVGLIEKYNLEYEGLDSAKTFECLIRTSRYERAKNLSEGYIKDTNLQKRFVWMQKYLGALFYLKQYSSVVDLAIDLQKLASILKIEPTYNTSAQIFFANAQLSAWEKAVAQAQTIEKNYKNEIKNIDIFSEILKHAIDSRDDLLLEIYAQKIIKIQKTYNTNTQSPFVEFSYIDALKRLGKIQKAFVVAKELQSKEISATQKTRALYLAGELAMKLGEMSQAKEYFVQCTQIQEKSSWKDICAQNLKLL